MSEQLRALGIDLMEGYGADQLALKPDMFVIGNVVSRARLANGAPKFPLMEAILDAGLPYASGPQWLAEHVLQGRHVLAVAGTHGKTSTTSMLAWALECAGLQPGFLVGGVPLNFGISARLGGLAAGRERPFFVIEADEYDTAFFDKRSKFVHYRPRTAVLNNLEFDHADIFGSLADIERQFHHLLRTVPATGRVIVNGQDANLARVLAQGVYSEVSRFGMAGGKAPPDFAASGEPGDFEVLLRRSPPPRRWRAVRAVSSPSSTRPTPMPLPLPRESPRSTPPTGLRPAPEPCRRSPRARSAPTPWEAGTSVTRSPVRSR